MKKAIILFSKIPEAGRVKSRLAATIGDLEAAKVQELLLKDLLAQLQLLSYDIFFYYLGDLNKLKIDEELKKRIYFRVQSGADLGEKMHNALYEVLETYDAAVLSGSDLPFVSAEDIEESLDFLNENDAVLAPASDGGYWLIGLKRPFKAVFENQPYGSSTVFESALKIMRQAGLKTAIAGEKSDLDTFSDMQNLREEAIALKAAAAPFKSAELIIDLTSGTDSDRGSCSGADSDSCTGTDYDQGTYTDSGSGTDSEPGTDSDSGSGSD